MVADDLISALREGSQIVSNRDDDMYDRLSNRWSIGEFYEMTDWISLTGQFLDIRELCVFKTPAPQNILMNDWNLGLPWVRFCKSLNISLCSKLFMGKLCFFYFLFYNNSLGLTE